MAAIDAICFDHAPGLRSGFALADGVTRWIPHRPIAEDADVDVELDVATMHDAIAGYARLR